MRVLFATTFLPRRRASGSEIASQAVVEALQAAGHDVRVVGYMRAGHTFEPDPTTEVCVGQRIMETSRTSPAVVAAWLARSAVRQIPYSCAKYLTAGYRNTVRQLLEREPFDLVVIDHVNVAWIERDLPPGLPRVFVAHNVEQQVYQQLVAQSGRGLRRLAVRREARLMARWEARIASRVNEVWTLSDHDAAHFRQSAATRVLSMHSFMGTNSNGSDAAPMEPTCDVALMGMWTWRPNAAGLRWFLDQVLPHLPQNIRIDIAGQGAEWANGKFANVTYRGFVPDAKDFLNASRVIAIPGVSGGGVQIKTLDAIALSQPVVASPVAVRGLCNLPATLQVADSPADFAACLMRAIDTPPDAEARRNAADWSRQRCASLREEVSAAVGALTDHRNGTSATLAPEVKA